MSLLKFISAIWFFTFVFYIFAPTANATNKSQLLVINQVRGEECCDKGSLENLKTQVEASIKYKIPAYFAIRYDALIDPHYADYLKASMTAHPDLIKPAVFFEITPNLAKESSVIYKGTDESWFGAENIFSIGYSNEDNKKMADLLFSNFKNTFGFYPEISTAWMIKTNLLNYLHEAYGLKVTEITREQIGTDSYTLDGGPPHYPYPAGKSWLFIPDYEENDSVLIVRQTITDPLFNYGDTTSSFTSQPNDYLRNKSFTYFKPLIDQALFEQKQTGFTLLGLENSMAGNFQKEYIKQLDLIRSYADKNMIVFPSVDDLRTFWNNKKLSVYQGSDLVKGTNNNAYWITTPRYRVRLRMEDGKVYISDIRIYDTGFSDPYGSRLAQREGFWIVPYLLNSSIQEKKDKNILNLFDPQPMPVNNFTSVVSDTNGTQDKINLPDVKGKPDITMSDDEIKFRYNSKKGTVNLVFKANSILTTGISKDDLKIADTFSNQLINEKVECSNNNCKLTFTSNNQFGYF